ncbi:hypothetical protein ACHWQZ_G015223 [Mnemiopsis leidyi]
MTRWLFAHFAVIFVLVFLHVGYHRPIQLAIISAHGNPLSHPAELSKCGKGGQNVYVREVGTHLSKMGFNVTVFTRSESEGDTGTVILSPTFRVTYVVAGPQQHLFRDLFYQYLEEFTSQIDPGEFDVVFSNYWLSGYVGLKLGLPQIHVHHSLGVQKFEWEPLTEIGKIRLAVEREINLKATCIVHQLKNEQELTNATRAIYIKPGIEVDKFEHLNKEKSKKKLKFDENVTNVLYVGRFAPQKGIKFAVEALHKSAVPHTFRLIGAYENTSSEYLLREFPQFEYLGPKPRSELAEYMSASDILLVPSLYEPFGLVVLEGMAAGCSMIVSAVGGPDELVEDGVNGLKVPPGDADAIREAFEKLAGNRTLMSEMGRRNRRTALGNSWKKTVENLGDLIVRITQQKNTVIHRLLDHVIPNLN